MTISAGTGDVFSVVVSNFEGGGTPLLCTVSGGILIIPQQNYTYGSLTWTVTGSATVSGTNLYFSTSQIYNGGSPENCTFNGIRL